MTIAVRTGNHQHFLLRLPHIIVLGVMEHPSHTHQRTIARRRDCSGGAKRACDRDVRLHSTLACVASVSILAERQLPLYLLYELFL